MLHVRTRLLIALENIFGIIKRKKVRKNILDKTFILVDGTFRDSADYDDAWLIALSLESKNVFDVGCNIGQSTILLLLNSNVDNILLIDPNPSALSICAENLIFNNLSHKARFVCAFASDKDDKLIDFFTTGIGAAGSMFKLHAVTASNIGTSLRVPTVSLDSLFKQYGILPDLVKIDVEGAEGLVLDGAKEIAKQHKTRFFVEMHSSPELTMDYNATKIIEWCSSLCYQPWYLKEKIKLKEPHQIAKRGRCHLLLLPIETPFPICLNSIEQGDSIQKIKELYMR